MSCHGGAGGECPTDDVLDVCCMLCAALHISNLLRYRAQTHTHTQHTGETKTHNYNNVWNKLTHTPSTRNRNRTCKLSRCGICCRNLADCVCRSRGPADISHRLSQPGVVTFANITLCVLRVLVWFILHNRSPWKQKISATSHRICVYIASQSYQS